MFNRRSLLKLLPAGILGSLFPAKKLFAGESKNKVRHYEIDGQKIHEITFFYTKSEIEVSNGLRSVFATFPANHPEQGHELMVPHFFFDKNGKVISLRDEIYGRIKINHISDRVPENAVFPKREWIDNQISCMVSTEKNQSHKNNLDLYVYVFLREDMPCLGLCCDYVLCKKALYSFRAF